MRDLLLRPHPLLRRNQRPPRPLNRGASRRNYPVGHELKICRKTGRYPNGSGHTARQILSNLQIVLSPEPPRQVSAGFKQVPAAVNTLASRADLTRPTVFTVPTTKLRLRPMTTVPRNAKLLTIIRVISIGTGHTSPVLRQVPLITDISNPTAGMTVRQGLISFISTH